MLAVHGVLRPAKKPGSDRNSASVSISTACNNLARRFAGRRCSLAFNVLSHQIKSICVHHLVPGGDEVVDEFFVVVVLGVDLGVGAQHGV